MTTFSSQRRADAIRADPLIPANIVSEECVLFIDDERDPVDDGQQWVIVRTAADAVAWMTQHGIPRYISFDHDLGNPDPKSTGAAVAAWIIEHDLDNGGTSLPHDFDYFVHSQNREGAADIVGKLDGYLNEKAKRAGRVAPARKRRSTVLR